MCRVVNLTSRFSVRYLERRHLRNQCGVAYFDECRRIGFCCVRDVGVHVG